MILYGLGVTHVGGDMFQSVPSGDAIFMKVCDNIIVTRIHLPTNIFVNRTNTDFYIYRCLSLSHFLLLGSQLNILYLMLLFVYVHSGC